MNGPKRHADRSAAGFTLVEVLVAFAVAVLVLGGLYEVYATGLRSGTNAEKYSDAVLLAESGLDALATGPLAPLDATDRIGAYERRISIRLRSDLASAAAQLAVVPYEIEIQVAWRDGIRERAVSLSTVRLGSSTESAP
jgi:general secretion pathway protein I